MELINNKFLLFGGKGGVGKTTMAAATALHTASKGKKTLILSTDPAHSLSDSFNQKIGDQIVKVKENLFASELDASLLLDDYKKKYGKLIQQIADEGTFFSKEDIAQFFDLSLPGMDELMALLKIMDILAQKTYDLIILDTAPSGHTIRLLELPNLMSAYLKVLDEMRQKHRVVVKMMVGRYRADEADAFIIKLGNDVNNLKIVLMDSSTKFVPVLIPEAMAINETQKLIDFLNKYKIRVEQIFVNQVMRNSCTFCNSRTKNQEKYLTQIKKKFAKFNIKEIPLFAHEIRGESLSLLESVLFDSASFLNVSANNSPSSKSDGGKDLPPLNLSSLDDKSSLDGKGTSLDNKSLSISKWGKSKFDKLTIKPSTKFLLLGGKGGVGKTSMAAAIALHESKDRKVMIFSTDPAHSLSDSFGVKIGDQITSINKNLKALEIDSYRLLNEMKLKYRKEIHDFFSSVFNSGTAATIDAPYDRRVIEDLFDLAPPGIDEIMALKTIMDLMFQPKSSNLRRNNFPAMKDNYDLFILDTAPTGHTIRLLEMPEVAEQWVSTLLSIQEKYPISFEIGDTLQEMLDAIKQVKKMLADPDQSEFIVVTIPESMGVLETQDLVSSLKKLKVFVEYLVINKIIPLSECEFCKVKRNEQDGYVKKLQSLKLKTVGIDFFENEIQGLPSLNELAKKLY